MTKTTKTTGIALSGLCLLALGCASSAPAPARPTPEPSAPAAPAPGQAALSEEERVEMIREILELTGAGELALQMMQAIIEPMKAAVPQVSVEWWEGFVATVDADDLDELVIPIYERHFTDQELEAMLEFHRTPAGRSIITKMPVVMQESMAAGQEWGRRLAEEMIRELDAAGYELPQRPQS